MVLKNFRISKEYGNIPTNTVTSLFSVYFKGEIWLYDVYLIVWAEDYVWPLVLHIDRPVPKQHHMQRTNIKITSHKHKRLLTYSSLRLTTRHLKPQLFMLGPDSSRLTTRRPYSINRHQLPSFGINRTQGRGSK